MFTLVQKKKQNTQSIEGNILKSQDIFGKYQSDCLKGIAIIMLIAHHCFLGPSRYKGQELIFIIPESVWNYVALFFKICVSLFVFISAYGLTKKMMSLPKDADSQTTHKFKGNMILSRVIRLLGGFIFVFLLVDIFALFYDPGRLAEIYGSVFPLNMEYYILDMLGLAQLQGTPTFLGTYWYYSLALILIVLVPLFYLLLEKVGSLAFLCAVAVLNFTVTFGNINIWHYILCIAVGIAAAYGNTITRMVQFRICGNNVINKILKFLLEFSGILLVMSVREGPLKGVLYPFWDAVIPVMVTAFGCEFLFSLPGLKQVLRFLGVYSANIFLVHNYIRRVWFYDFTYSFKYPLLIVSVLMIISLMLSIGIEFLKKVLHYNEAVGKIVKLVSRGSRKR